MMIYMTNQPSFTATRFPLFLKLDGLFASLEEAQAAAARFPKVCNAKVRKCQTWNTDGTVLATLGSVSVTVELKATEGNEANESGVKRFEKALEVVKAQGWTLETTTL